MLELLLHCILQGTENVLYSIRNKRLLCICFKETSPVIATMYACVALYPIGRPVRAATTLYTL